MPNHYVVLIGTQCRNIPSVLLFKSLNKEVIFPFIHVMSKYRLFKFVEYRLVINM